MTANPAKFHSNRIWNDKALDTFEEGHPNKNKKKNKMNSDIESLPGTNRKHTHT